LDFILWLGCPRIVYFYLHNTSFDPVPSLYPFVSRRRLAFGPVWGTVYPIIGATLGAVLSFGLARVLGANLFRVRLEKWRKLETQLREKGFLYILLL
jgi:uncharacterized membrane protein YdjX (TVP38/TMEM64 family)